ncbi:DNA-binding domain-containing protein [Dyella acidiphila]|uniref:DNA-binding domain-containing protein n=1 Tax=Dyella acidiphila TaxID=2775866 RepID=A0ABR9G5N3_9GAMM|nr:DNA-binding domain-containing protein [Dyella acidiphila]MBE1159328.1 putative DNA-binding domain-containing protein [Dyella acidiphila]
MSSLQALQQQLLQAVLSERTPATLPLVRADGIADTGSRLEVYRHGYRVRLRDALKQEFPGLHHMAGAQFERLLDKYVAAHPSEHYNIRWYGAGLAAFLDYARPWRDRPALAEMARVDWAISIAFDAADEPSANIAELSAVAPEAWPGLQLSLQQNLHVLDCRFNTAAFRRAADQGGKRPRLRRLQQPRQLLVWRKDSSVHYRQLEVDEWQALGAAIRGEPFAALCAQLAAYHAQASALPRMVALLQGWLEAGLIRGWSFA